MNVVDRVLSFWFQEEVLDLAADGDYRIAWFKKNDAFDKAIKDQFEPDVIAAATGKYNALRKTVEGVLALTLLLDQFPRNIYRGSPKAFATDALALNIAKSAIANGLDESLGKTRRMFLYLPFEHSESLSDQNIAVRLFRGLNDERSYTYALEHYYIISQFGRFPGRNKALGRDTTPEELDFLKLFGSY